jgi:hypothetical protein
MEITMAVNDPDDLEEDDRELRIRELRRRAEELSGGKFTSSESPDCPPEILEQFLKQVIAYEQAEQVTLFDRLIKAGVSVPSPDELDDHGLTVKLWEIIRALSLLGAYLYNTNHLSDRELYTHLWAESLREETILFPDNPDFACHIDLVGSGSEEDILKYLKYYASEADRQDWAKRWPLDLLPQHEQPAFDRDCQLPGQPDPRAAEDVM